MSDEDGYPTDEELAEIIYWDFQKKSIYDFLEFIENLWYYPDRFELRDGYKNFPKRIKVKKLYLSTGGWSGNETIINAVERNFIFWMICWQKSQRGGHYWFEINPNCFVLKEKDKKI